MRAAVKALDAIIAEAQGDDQKAAQRSPGGKQTKRNSQGAPEAGQTIEILL